MCPISPRASLTNGGSEPVVDDDHLISLSALQHYLFCPRQCALIHIDGLWAENRLTTEGMHLHQRVDSPGATSRRPREEPLRGVRVVRAMPLLCKRLGIIGKADCVEFKTDEPDQAIGPPRPIEHKRGRPKRGDADKVQLCAQALCLEEMCGCDIPEGELFYHAVRRRLRVPFDDALRQRTEQAIVEIRILIETNITLRVEFGPKCKNCSLLNLCLPKGTNSTKNPKLYLSRALAKALEEPKENNP
jgi:CRISPR-associated exonuclease Cas4